MKINTVAKSPQKKPAKKKKNKNLDKKLMGLWQEIVKLRANYKCEYPQCERTANGGFYMNAHHFYSKKMRSTRWNPDNGICLCSYHHTLSSESAHNDPRFKDIILTSKIRTTEWFDNITLKAFKPAKPDMEMLFVELTDIRDSLLK